MKTFLEKQFLNRHFLLFLGVNTFAAVVNFSSRIFLGEFMSYTLSIIVAYIVGMIVSFSLCRLFLFQESNNKKSSEILYFTVINIVSVILTVCISLFMFHIGLLMMRDLFLREEVAHGIGLCAPAFLSYLGHKYITFRTDATLSDETVSVCKS